MVKHFRHVNYCDVGTGILKNTNQYYNPSNSRWKFQVSEAQLEQLFLLVLFKKLLLTSVWLCWKSIGANKVWIFAFSQSPFLSFVFHCYYHSQCSELSCKFYNFFLEQLNNSFYQIYAVTLFWEGSEHVEVLLFACLRRIVSSFLHPLVSIVAEIWCFQIFFFLCPFSFHSPSTPFPSPLRFPIHSPVSLSNIILFPLTQLRCSTHAAETCSPLSLCRHVIFS